VCFRARSPRRAVVACAHYAGRRCGSIPSRVYRGITGAGGSAHKVSGTLCQGTGVRSSQPSPCTLARPCLVSQYLRHVPLFVHGVGQIQPLSHSLGTSPAIVDVPHLTRHYHTVLPPTRSIIVQTGGCLQKSAGTTRRSPVLGEQGYLTQAGIADRLTNIVGVDESRWAPQSSKLLRGVEQTSQVGSTPIHSRLV
jgi:hypothetical protein